MDALRAFLEVAGIIGVAILVMVLINIQFKKPWR
jgi:hypothetical protein